jgi:DNA primase
MKPYNAREWVSFRELRARLRFEDVLRHHKVEICRKGEQHQGPCPLPRHGDRPNVAPFSAHLGKGIFQCFGCSAKGNLLEFSALMSGVDPEDGNAFRRAMTELAGALIPEKGGARQPAAARAERPRAESKAPESREPLVNAPLDFELKGLEHEHPALTGGGLLLKTIVRFGAGFCSRGMLAGKVAIPLHDPEGRLVGYAGADSGGGPIDRCRPALSFPEGRERKGRRLEFRPSLLLYNAHRVGTGLDEIIVAPGPEAVWWLHQCGFPNAVAPLGDELSERQAELVAGIVRPDGRVRVLLPRERDEGRMALSLLIRLSSLRFIRTFSVPTGGLVSDMGAEALSEALTG